MYDFGMIYEPGSVSEALQMMQTHPEARILAGGSDLLIQMRAGMHGGIDVISIYGIDALRGVSMDEVGTIAVGALTSISHIVKNELIQTYIPVLAEAIGKLGGPQVRNIATIGGNVCNGHTGADSGAVLVALDAEVELKSVDGVRIVPISDFYQPTGHVDLRPGELLTGFLLKKEKYDGFAGAHYKYAKRNAMDVDVTGCATCVKLTADKLSIAAVRIAFGVMGPMPVRAFSAEKLVQGQKITPELITQFADEAVKGLSPRSDYRASADFRMHTAHVMARRTLAEALAAAGEVM